MHVESITPTTITNVELLGVRADACESFAWQVNACYDEQEAGGPRYGLSRDDLRYCWAVAKHARLRHEGAVHDELRHRWGKPEDIRAAARLPISPELQRLVLDDRPKVPLDPSREPHAIPDVPSIRYGWSAELRSFLAGRRVLVDTLRERDRIDPIHRGPAARVPDQVSFIERSQPPEPDDPDDSDELESHEQPEREPGDDPDEPDEPEDF